MTKLTDRNIRFICRHSVDVGDWSNRQLAEHYGVTIRRVEQLVKEYKETGKYPTQNPNRRPKSKPLTVEEKGIIDEYWERHRVGSRLLYKALRKDGYKIPHHKIRKYLLATNRIVPNPRKQKKRKRCRYEREYSFSLVHGDWHRTSIDHPYCIIWLDDASRFILSGGEFSESTAKHSVETLSKAIDVAWNDYSSYIREVNTDRGTQFFVNKQNRRGTSTNEFQRFLKEHGIVHVVSRKSNPQTNGKIERLWLEYDRHRWRFSSLDEFISWYNSRIHGALWVDIGETPEEAVYRKLQPEAIIGLFWRGIE